MCARRGALRQGRRGRARADPGRGRRGRNPGGPARGDIPRRRRLPRQRVHHRLQPGRAPLRLPSRAGASSTSGADRLRIRRHVPALRRGDHADGAGGRSASDPCHLSPRRPRGAAGLRGGDEARTDGGRCFAAHARVFAEHGLTRHRLNACGYSLGAHHTPSWMDWPMFYEGNPWVIEPGMVLFAHMILMDSDTETALCLGRTSVVTETGSRAHQPARPGPAGPLAGPAALDPVAGSY